MKTRAAARPLSVFVLLALLLAAPAAARAETLTLADCLREIVERNPDIAAARHDLERAAGTRLVLRARALPQLTIGLVAGQQGAEQTLELRRVTRDPTTGQQVVTILKGPRPSRVFTLGFGNGFQPLFDFGALSSWRRGDREVALAEQNFYVIATTVLHTARLQFYTAIYQRDNERLLRGIAGRLAANEQVARQQQTAGLLPRTSLLQARVQGIGFAPAVLAAGGASRSARIQLLALMGRDLGPASGPPGGGGRDPLANVQLDGALDTNGDDFTFNAATAAETALRQRPDLQALRATLAALVEDIHTARAGYYPSFRLVALGTLIPQNAVRSEKQAIRAGDDTRTTEIRYGADFNWTVIDTGAVTAQVRGTRDVRDIIALRLRDQEESVPRDLARLRLSFDTAAARRRSLREGREAAQATFDAIEQAVTQGTASQYEFLQAQNDLLANRGGILQAAFEQQTLRAEFDRLTGGYLRFVAPEPAPRPRTPGK